MYQLIYFWGFSQRTSNPANLSWATNWLRTYWLSQYPGSPAGCLGGWFVVLILEGWFFFFQAEGCGGGDVGWWFSRGCRDRGFPTRPGSRRRNGEGSQRWGDDQGPCPSSAASPYIIRPDNVGAWPSCNPPVLALSPLGCSSLQGNDALQAHGDKSKQELST